MSCGTYYNSIMGAVGPALSGNQPALDNLPSPSIRQMCANIVQGLLQDGMQIQAHKRILCELMCCCNTSALPLPAPRISEPGENVANPTRQSCVERAVNGPVPVGQMGVPFNPQVAEVTYNMQFPQPVPMMDYLGGSAMGDRVASQTPQVDLYGSRPLHYHGDFGRILGRSNREFDPTTRLLRDAAGLPRFRRPDVVVRRNPNNPLPYDRRSFPGLGEVLGDNSNILAVFEMKFPGDRPRPGQYRDYRQIAGRGRFFELTTARNSCNCQTGRRNQQSQFAEATQPYSSPAGELGLSPTMMPDPPVPAATPTPVPEIDPGGGGWQWPEIDWPTFPLPGPSNGKCPRLRKVPIC